MNLIKSAAGKFSEPVILVDKALKSSSVLLSSVVECFDEHDFGGAQAEAYGKLIYFV